ncbi:MAG: hypothetical protein LBP33_08890, partial [Candidatus Adiutrix sp.]|nr:hypothetical protein [Candidatus Adiutrix sp.]
AGEKERARAEIEIDLSRLQGIRAAALATRDRLMVEEEDDAGAPQISGEKAGGGDRAGLDETERRLLSCLLHGRAYGRLVQSPGLGLPVLVDSINDKLFDVFGDTVITGDGARPELVADYIETLKEMFQE